MRFLLRLATRAAWPGGEPDRERALADFRLREGEIGLPLWAYDGEEERNLVLGAITCDRLHRKGKADNVDFLEIPANVVDELGPVAETLGDTPVPRANVLHRELQWPSEKLRELAEALFDANCSAIRVRKSRALDCALALNAVEVESEQVRSLLDHERAGRKKER